MAFPLIDLPKKVVEKDLSIIEKMGIEVHLKTRVGKVSVGALLQGFDAIFIATAFPETDRWSRPLRD